MLSTHQAVLDEAQESGLRRKGVDAGERLAARPGPKRVLITCSIRASV